LNLLPIMALATLTLDIGLAAAEEFDGMRADRLLPDADFFRLATCGANPGGPCRSPTVSWPAGERTVTLLPGDSTQEVAAAGRVSVALNAAIAQINGTGTGLHLIRVSDAEADIRIQTADIAEGTALQDVPGVSARGIMGVGYVSLWWNDATEITDASILFATSLSDADTGSVVLEELFQSLGPRFDIEGPAYEGVSILSQTSNATTLIEGQDAALLRWLYPPNP
jgi:Protein of unknown function (DUF2927)